MQTDTFDPQQFEETRSQSNEQILDILDDQQKAIFKQINKRRFSNRSTKVSLPQTLPLLEGKNS